MIPYPARALADLAGKLATDIAPEAGTPYAVANTGLIAGLLMALAQDSERAVANRCTDIDEIRTLFAGLDAHPANDPQLARGAAARDALRTRQPQSLHLRDVDALHAEAMALLIDVHEWAEDHDSALDLRIWELLARHAERNRLDVPL